MATVRKDGGNVHKAKTINPIYKAAKSATNYVGNIAREIRDIPTAVGASVTRNGQPSGGRNSTLIDQIKEAGAAITAGQKGSSVNHYTASKKEMPSKLRK